MVAIKNNMNHNRNFKYIIYILLVVVLLLSSTFIWYFVTQQKANEEKLKAEINIKNKELILKQEEIQNQKDFALEEKTKELELKEKEIENHKEFINYLKKVPEYKSKNISYPGIFPQTSMKYLNYDDIKGLSSNQLRLMRNEIFARHGYIFKSDDLKNYFSKQGWYSPRFSDVTGKLSNIEKSNIEFIKSYE